MADHEIETMRLGHLDIDFDPTVLRPRTWTEAQSRWVAELLVDAAAGPVLELCTGVGHIGLLAVAESGRRLVAVDVSPRAIELAGINAERAGMGDQIDLRTGELEDVLAEGETFPVALADPPWVTSDGVADLPEDPELAIDGGEDGLDIARRCLAVFETHLESGGVGIIQLGTADQAAALGEWAHSRGHLVLGEVRTFDRGVLARVDRV